MRRVPLFALGVVVIAAMVSACGGSKSASPSTSAATPPPPPTTSTQPTGGNPGTNKGGGTAALKAEAAATATGDIPDNQVFVTFTSPTGGYQLQVPEGWARTDDPSGPSCARGAGRSAAALVDTPRDL